MILGHPHIIVTYPYRVAPTGISVWNISAEQLHITSSNIMSQNGLSGHRAHSSPLISTLLLQCLAGSVLPAAETETSALSRQSCLLCSLWQIAWVRRRLWHWLSTNTQSTKMWGEVWASEIIKWMMRCLVSLQEGNKGFQALLIDLRGSSILFSFGYGL